MVHAVIQLLLLLLAVPAQYLISAWLNPNPSSTTIEVLRIAESIPNFVKTWSHPRTWQTELKKAWLYWTTDQGECIAKEVFEYRQKNGDLASSLTPRSHRDKNVKYYIGQVVKHKKSTYLGVIIGWNLYSQENEKMPYYKILIDKKQSTSISTYLNQNDVETVIGKEINNDLIADYFEFFDGVVYHPRAFLKQLYPLD